MASDLSWKNHNFIFTPKTTSASMLTCRRRAADMPQTLTQTTLLTLKPQEARKGVFSGRIGITHCPSNKGCNCAFISLYSILILFIDRDLFYECSR